jgi:hypothetical protein
MAKPRAQSLPAQRRPHGLRFCALPCSTGALHLPLSAPLPV